MTSRFILALALLAGSAGAASAQQAGTYSGTATDGSMISFVIGTDPNTGALQVTSAGISFSDTCKPGAFTYNSGWGLGGDGTDLSGAKSTYTYSFGYFYVTATLNFSGSMLTGTIENATPTLVAPASGEPKKAAYCSSKKQAYTASLQPGNAAHMPMGQPRGLNFGGTVIRH